MRAPGIPTRNSAYRERAFSRPLPLCHWTPDEIGSKHNKNPNLMAKACLQRRPQSQQKKSRKRMWKPRNSLGVWGRDWAEQTQRRELRRIRAKQGSNQGRIPVSGILWEFETGTGLC